MFVLLLQYKFIDSQSLLPDDDPSSDTRVKSTSRASTSTSFNAKVRGDSRLENVSTPKRTRISSGGTPVTTKQKQTPKSKKRKPSTFHQVPKVNNHKTHSELAILNY